MPLRALNIIKTFAFLVNRVPGTRITRKANDFHGAEHHSLSPESPALGAVVGGGPVGRAPLDGRLAPHEGVEPLPDVAHLTAISN